MTRGPRGSGCSTFFISASVMMPRSRFAGRRSISLDATNFLLGCLRPRHLPATAVVRHSQQKQGKATRRTLVLPWTNQLKVAGRNCHSASPTMHIKKATVLRSLLSSSCHRHSTLPTLNRGEGEYFVLRRSLHSCD